MAEVADNTVVDGRYRILSRIGEGGMADVFCAEDSNLGRRVALKVLHERFARDRQFVERFRREASAAAGLQHPQVVGVFDRGDHEGTYYIAMELLEGRTLKDLIVAEAPLAQDRTIDLGVQILAAAGFAHRHGIIHRDFKPQNVIVDDGDHLKVTDFGIARAGVSEMTETGSILGTAQYLSPEQAQGRSVDASSDIYSIGVMLYEMLAGRVPFEGDSAISVAVKHLNEVPAPLHTIRPDIHPMLEAAVMRALSKDPARRFADAAAFVAALTAAREALDVPYEYVEPLPAVPMVEEEERGRPRWVWVATAVLVLALLALLLFLGLRSDGVEVATVTGRPVAEAVATLERQGLRPRVERVASPAPLDSVVDQDPKPGAAVESGAPVLLRISGGPGEAMVPSVRNLSKRRAVEKLNDAGLNVEEEPQASSSIEKGLAVRTAPRAGERVEKGSRVRLYVSTGPKQVRVPDVVGLSRDSAETRLEDGGLVTTVEQQPSDEAADRVLSQSPEGGKIDEGSEVTIVVSEGPPEDTPSDVAPTPDATGGSVPDVGGQAEGDARSAVEAEGYSVEVREKQVSASEDDGVVVKQRPSPGRRLASGRTVVIYVGRADDGL